MDRLKQNLIEYVSNPNIGDIRIYKFVLQHFNQDQKKADEFMLSDGGYTAFQLHRIKYHIDYFKKKYQEKLMNNA